MAVRIRDGWIHGELPGPAGRTYQAERAPCHDFSFVRVTIPRPNLVLLTTQAPITSDSVGGDRKISYG